jgi:hypothetical protein
VRRALANFFITLQLFLHLSVSCAMAASYYDIIPSSFAIIKYVLYFLYISKFKFLRYYFFSVCIATVGSHYGIILGSPSYATVLLCVEWLKSFVHVYQYIRSSMREDNVGRSPLRKKM